MPAEFESGMGAQTPFWHGAGTIIKHWPGTWKEAWDIATAGNPWDVVTAPVAVQAPDGTWEQVAATALVRDDNHKLLGMHGPSYSAITNAQFGELIETALDIPGIELAFDALVSLREGRVIAATMKMPKGYHVPGDPSELQTYVVFYTSHDGSAALQLGPCPVRVVCMNTQKAASEHFGRRGGYAYTLRHTKGWRDRIKEVKEGLAASVNMSLKFHETALFLAEMGVTEAYVQKFVDRYIPISTDMTDTVRIHREAERAEFMGLFLGHPTMEGMEMSRWRLYQAVTLQRDWYSAAHTVESRTERSLITGDERTKKALALLGK